MTLGSQAASVNRREDRIMNWSRLYNKMSQTVSAKIAGKALGRLLAPLARMLDWIETSGKIRYFRNIKIVREAYVLVALQAQREGKNIEALGKWETILREWPNDKIGYWGVVGLAIGTGQLPYASKVVGEGLKRFPDDTQLIASAANLAGLNGDWASGLALLEKSIHTPNLHVEYLRTYAHALLVLGKYDRLEPLLKDLRARFPDHPAFLAMQAMLASARHRFDEALAIWSEFRILFPGDSFGWEQPGHVYHTRELARFDEPTDGESSGSPEAVVPAAPMDVGFAHDEEIRALLLGFESIGANCEFGLVQRRYGAEPLGLLRFNSVTLEGLLSALVHRFDKIGEAETTELTSLAGEYYITDRRWGLGMHTFIYKGQQEPDVLYSKFCRRLVYLKEKALSDLSEAKKVFVFKSPGMRMDELSTLHRALKSIGPVTLLYVTAASAKEGIGGDQAGEVKQIDRDLFVGSLSRLGEAEGFWNIAFDEWVAICRKVRGAIDEAKVSVAECLSS
jgi:tetratricopeptide (TPR) repeat protein